MKEKAKAGIDSAWKDIDRMVDDRIKSGKAGDEVKLINRWKLAVRNSKVK